MEQTHHTIDEWEEVVGAQVRDTRIAARLDQVRLAALADISVATLSNLERGRGSSLKTIIAVVRALDRTDWLESLAPPVAVSPMAMLRSRRSTGRPRRVRARQDR